MNNNHENKIIVNMQNDYLLYMNTETISPPSSPKD